MYLLDTHVLIWFLINDKEKLSTETIEIFNDEANMLYFSVASIWELSIKASLGKPDFSYDPKQIAGELLRLGFVELPISISHVCAIDTLPLIHRDPFDRLLLVQAKLEKLVLLTADTFILKYERINIQDVRQ
ncbi:type II toxin-antitoxin system VapC family toxin [uncultured Psychrobacter sp.]|uniref:type II toxin-antitoxin system VapC family toxin n=1 Tax=uncultured Psychrobacter sp. TaxID=259303 RepID=UPI0034593742